MDFQFIKNIHFTRLVKANGRLREFNFRKSKSSNGQFDIFSVDVVDDRGNRIMFIMKKEEEKWKIISTLNPLPAWITGMEESLHNLIEEEI